MDPNYINRLLPQNTEPTLQFLVFFIIVSFIPLIVLTTTPFLRIVIVLYMLRGAVGIQQSPPNLVITGLSLILSVFVMQGELDKINKEAIIPLSRKEINLGQAMSIAYIPLKERMLKQVEERDIAFMYNLTEQEVPDSPYKIDFVHLVSAHILTELRIAFSLGFLMYIPFLVVDLIVSNTLLALGMMMLSPTIISLPFKLMIFVAVDAWALVIKGLVESFK